LKFIVFTEAYEALQTQHEAVDFVRVWEGG
jgi:hypothetical protein